MPGERILSSLLTRLRPLSYVFFAACLLVSPPRSSAVDTITLDLGEVQGKGWGAHDVTVALELLADGKFLATLRASRVTLSPEFGSLTDVTLTCLNPVVKEPDFSCRNAKVIGQLGRLGRQQLTASVAYDSEHATLIFSTQGLKVAGGAARFNGRWLESGWQAELQTQSAHLAELRKLLAPWIALPEDFSLDGRASLTTRVRGSASLEAIDISGTFADLTANNAAGTIATDKLGLELEATLKPVGADWDIHARLKSNSGQAYSDPIFVDFGQYPLEATVDARWLSERGIVRLAPLEVEQRGVVSGRIAGEIDLEGESFLRQLRVDLRTLEFPGAFASLIQPFLISTEFKDFTTSGRVSGTIEIDAGAPAVLELRLDQVTAEDKAGKLGFDALTGHISWLSTSRRVAANSDLATAPPSRLEWKSAMLYGIAGGPAHIDFAASGADFRVLEPTLIPILDGGLRISTLSVREFGAPEMSLRFAAALEPISMPLLCRAFGWPEFAGKLEGRIPEVTLDQNVLSFGGDLEALAFGGRIVVNGLKLQDPLGDYPRLNANLTARNLDLEAVTGTFEFGEITGRLDADVRGLELFRWSPLKFDAKLYTPPGDKSRHLISQRAVKNLSNIGGSGGGVAAVLQGGFLRFFENFRYARLGLSCRLENEVCHMDGIEPQQGDAYYIVKGSGIPRIDIIGNAHLVNWNRLVGQLKAIQESGGPVVK